MPDTVQQRQVSVPLNRGLHEFHERTFRLPKADRLLCHKTAQDVGELEVDQRGRCNRRMAHKPLPHRPARIFINDGSDPDASVGYGHLPPAARNQVQDLAICQLLSATQPGSRENLRHPLGRDVLGQHLQDIGGERLVDLISSLPKDFKNRLRYVSDLKWSSHP